MKCHVISEAAQLVGTSEAKLTTTSQIGVWLHLHLLYQYQTQGCSFAWWIQFHSLVCTWECNEGVRLTGHFGFPLMHVCNGDQFSHSIACELQPEIQTPILHYPITHNDDFGSL
jgi:hypothetical protein